jgi:hypothetical protein
MAREVVITSVPRGIRLGRTGFQMVMRTAGLRDDVCDQLESLAVYRHLPPGTGPNPACYFHRVIQTGVGALSVLGRIVDAGADYSSRSNKLAHIVAIDQSEIVALRQSSPAAVLAAIESRLAATWPGGPEERAGPFGLAGMPPIQPAVCATWQQVLGDAGWGGVLADRALANRPVLVVAPDSSPAWCRRLLVLFAEALALVPPQKRWAVTFDTTILSAAPVSWRGTYAGSPESSLQQPGLLVVDLRRRVPIPVPADMAGSPLVAQARTGRVAGTGSGVGAPGGPPVIPGPPVPGGAVGGLSPTLFDGLSAMPSGGPVPEPPPSRTTSARAKRAARREGYHDYEDPYADRWKMWATVAALGSLMLLAGGVYAFFHFDVIGQVRHRLARAHLDAWAQQGDGKQPAGAHSEPDVKTWTYAYSVPGGGQKKKNEPPAGPNPELLAKKELLDLLNSALLTAAVTPETIKTGEQAQRLIDSCSRLMSKELQVADFAVIGATLPEGDEATTARVVGWINELLKKRSSDKPQPPTEVLAAVSDWVQRLTPLAGLCTAGGPAEVKDLLPGLALALNQSDKLDDFAISLVTKKTPVTAGMTLTDLRVAFATFSAPRTASANAERRPNPNSPSDAAAQDAQRESAWKEFVARFNQLGRLSRDATGIPDTVALVNGIKDSGSIEWKKVDVTLPTLGDTWRPRARRAEDEDKWILRGLPDEPEKPWGALRLSADGDTGQKQLVFERWGKTPWYCGYVPIVLQHRDYPAQTRPLTVLPQPQQLRWMADEGAKTTDDNATTTSDGAKVTLLSLVAPESDASDSPLPRFHIREWPERNPLPESLSRFWTSPPVDFTDTEKTGFSFGLVHETTPSDVAGGSNGTLCIRWIETNVSPGPLTLEEDVATWDVDTAAVKATFSRPVSQVNWTDLKTRWKTLSQNSGTDDKELNWLGIQPSKNDGATREFRKCDKDHWVKLLVAIFEAGQGGETKKTVSDVRKCLDEHWHEPDSNKGKELSLLDWRGIVRDYLRPIIESEFLEPRPKQPDEPSKGKDDEEDQRLQERWKSLHNKWKSEEAEWARRKDTFVNNYLADARQMRGFLEPRRSPLSPEQAMAVTALAELDSVIVAKLRRAELKKELENVTLRDAVGGLKLELVLPWIIAGREEPFEIHAAIVSGFDDDTATEGHTPQ